MVALGPPEWRRRRPPLEVAIGAAKALRRAVRDSWVLTRRRTRSWFGTELLLTTSTGVVYFVIGPDPGPDDPPKWIIAAGIAIAGVVVAAAAVFLATLLWTPFTDHRKLVIERDQARAETEAAKADHEHLLRSIHLRHWMNNSSLWAENLVRLLQHVTSRGDSWDPDRMFQEIEERCRYSREALERFGQPTLAAQIEIPEKPATVDVEACMGILQELNTFFRQWAHGARDIPRFASNASSEGLQLPTLYGP